ncbi:hypothetical protein [Alteromonas sp. W364]|uniref:hypothetical protein n=1 Tax=Alteromonas sp. W364 TaxID=3075610 RepID=UPI0028842D76|nr:hypothetical protein [Alteromonas sp. W364]MDT0630090.1 hypothetical protein [Alteromonas sp. W364]
MKKVSTSPFFFKKVFPVFWLGFVFLFFIVSIALGAYEKSIMFVVAPIIMIVFGVILFKKLVWDLCDEVIDEGESLLIKKGKLEQRVLLKDVVNINHQLSSPERVVLSVRTSGSIGKELAFIPLMHMRIFSKNKHVIKLIQRVDDARRT